MRIQQAYISKSLGPMFKNEFLSRWDLREYDNPEEPAFFWGLQKDKEWEKDRSRKGRRKSVDADLYTKHKGFKILHFVGGEFNNGLLHLIDKKNAIILCTDIGEVWLCKKLKLNHKHLKIPYFDLDFHNSSKLGDKIYSHIPSGHEVGKINPELEYSKLIQLLSKKNFCIPNSWCSIQQLVEFFNLSYCNIKSHWLRGNVTSWRLGLMGRKTITKNEHRWAESGPQYLYYNTDDELVNLVEIESEKIGTFQDELAHQVRNCYHESDDWLYESYWK